MKKLWLLAVAMVLMGAISQGSFISTWHFPITIGAAGQVPIAAPTDTVSGLATAMTWGSAITTHTLTGLTPTAAVAFVGVPYIDVQNQVLAGNVSSMTLPAFGAVADGEIIHWFVQQGSGGAFTLPSGTVGPLTAGASTTVTAATGVTCPAIGSTTGAIGTASELHMNIIYRAGGSTGEWIVETCVDVR